MPSRQRGHDIALYYLPEDANCCYEFSFKRTNSREDVSVYICTLCRALKEKHRNQYTGTVPSKKVRNGQFITEPRLNHFCTPKSSGRAIMRREIIRKCDQARMDASLTVARAKSELLPSIENIQYEHLDEQERMNMVDELAVGIGGAMDTFRKKFHWNKTRQDRINPVRLGKVPQSLCSIDQEDFVLYDENNILIIGSRRIWRAIFNEMHLETFLGDGRFKQIPLATQRGRSSQFYTVLAEVNDRHTLPVFFAFLPDSRKETYKHLFRWFRENIGDALVRIQRLAKPFITDFEKGAINAIQEELRVDVLGCLFHFDQAILRNRDRLGLNNTAKKNRAVAVFFRRIQMLPLLREDLHGISGALIAPERPIVTASEEHALLEFMQYMRNTWLPPNGTFHGLWNHSTNEGTPRTPNLREMVEYCREELTMAKAKIRSILDGSLNVRYLRPDERERQTNVIQEMRNFRESISHSLPTSRQCKTHLDNLDRFLATDS
ncbi:hypothetical protein ANCCAN_15632 [Ancylostoma caninum]|uniref:Uncharacterized protein n=1 Tax=Ancylostoma caninum TaxID=29170 RepID=A0A368G582_ANCCA|nr:hypothetical protein ANCCAN_15632 [Ancylostoma caninum]